MTTFRDLSNQMHELLKRLHDEGDTKYREAVSKFMDTYPTVVGFTFQQYTPSFNDGDVCLHTLRGPYLHFESDKELQAALTRASVAESKICIQCSKTNIPEALFCLACGTQLPEPKALPQSLTVKEFISLGISSEGHESYDLTRRGEKQMGSDLAELSSKTLLEQIYGTNKEFIAVRSKNGLEVEVRDYDPGY